METNILEETQRLLAKRPFQRTSVIARGAGVKYHWLRNFRKGKIAEPGCKRVQALYNWLTKNAL